MLGLKDFNNMLESREYKAVSTDGLVKMARLTLFLDDIETKFLQS